MKTVFSFLFAIIIASFMILSTSAATYTDDMLDPGSDDIRNTTNLAPLKLTSARLNALEDKTFLSFAVSAYPTASVEYNIENAKTIKVGIYTHTGTFIGTNNGSPILGFFQPDGNSAVRTSETRAIYNPQSQSVFLQQGDALHLIVFDNMYKFSNNAVHSSGDLIDYGVNVYCRLKNGSYVKITLYPERINYTANAQYCYEEFLASIPDNTVKINVEINDFYSYLDAATNTPAVKSPNFMTSLALVEFDLADPPVIDEPPKNPDSDSDSNPDPDPSSDSDPYSKPEPDTDSNSDTEPNPDPDPNPDSKLELNPDSNPDPDSQQNPELNQATSSNGNTEVNTTPPVLIGASTGDTYYSDPPKGRAIPVWTEPKESNHTPIKSGNDTKKAGSDNIDKNNQEAWGGEIYAISKPSSPTSSSKADTQSTTVTNSVQDKPSAVTGVITQDTGTPQGTSISQDIQDDSAPYQKSPSNVPIVLLVCGAGASVLFLLLHPNVKNFFDLLAVFKK